MAISNLTTQYISASFQSLMQVSSSGLIYDGIGTQVTNLVLTSVTASFNGLATSASSAILANTATSASVAATVTTAAQPTITSVGTLTGLAVAGNVSVTGTLTANTYILSSSVTNMTVEFASGSTAFGNTSDDTHKFIGSVIVTGSLVVSGSSTFRNIGPAQFTGSVISTQGFTGSLQGTASIATNVAYSGLTGTVPTWNQNTTGNAATATTATTVTTNANLTGVVTSIGNTTSIANSAITNAMLFNSSVANLSGTNTGDQTNITGNAATATNVAYTGLTGTVPTWNQNTTGNAATATNVAYTGLTGAVPTWNQNTTGNAATATSASTATSATSATTAATASFISATFISASVASSGFGSITPASASYSITSSYALSASNAVSSSYSIIASNANNTPYSGLTGAVTTWNQNTTGNAATATTASFAVTASYIDPTFISASAAASGFGSATVSASYAVTASYIDPTFISASAAAAGFGTGGAAATGSVTINNNVNDYIVTATGTANTLNGESALTFNGTTLGVGITSPYASVKAHIKGILAIENGSTAGTLADQLFFGYDGSGLTQYNHKIQTSHDSLPALNKMDFLISNGASTFLNVLNLRSLNLSRFDSGQGLGVSGSLQVTGSTIITGNVSATSFTGSLQGTATTASYINPAFISASAAASGFGTGGAGSVSASYAATASFAILAVTASYISPTFISASAAAAGFGSGGGASVSASYAATASYVLQAISASFATTSDVAIAAYTVIKEYNATPMRFYQSNYGGQPTYLWGTYDANSIYLFDPSNFNVASAATASYINPTFISASAAAAGFGTGGGGSVSASYAATASYVLQAISASFATLAGTSTTATNAANVGITNQNSVEDTFYVTFVNGTSGNLPLGIDSNSLQYDASTNTLTVTNVAGNASTATTATTASYISGSNVIGSVSNSNALNGNADSYYTNASNISSGTISNSYLPAAINITSVTASFKGNLVGTASWASNATNATTATTANGVAFSGITSLPAGISVTGVAAVEDITNSPATASLLTNGTFYSVAASTKVVNILLDEATMPIGTEFTFFAKNLTNPITFNVTPDSPDSIISENGYLSMYGTGSAATAKLISTGPAIWALIGSLKAS